MFCDGTEIVNGAGHDFFMSHVDVEGGALIFYLFFLIENIGLSEVFH